MNEIKLSGKVISPYIDKRGFLSVIISTVHEHTVNGMSDATESVFRAVLADKEKSKNFDIMKGDKVSVVGYLKQDMSISSGGNEHKRVNIYIKDIEVIQPKIENTTSFVKRFFK